jgi:hypothetical protein
MNLRAISLRSFKTNYPLWYALSLAVYLCSFPGRDVVAALFYNRPHSRVFSYDVFSFEFVCPIAISIVMGWLAQCAIAIILSWRGERSPGADLKPYGAAGQKALTVDDPPASARAWYPPFAFIGAIAVQWHLLHRLEMLPFDYEPPEIWIFENLGLTCLALLLLAPVLRHGRMWERMVAALLSVLPASAVAGGFYFVFTQLTEP